MKNPKFECIYNYLKNKYKEYDIDHRKSPSIVGSYDFAIDTGKARVVIKIKRSSWDDYDENDIQELLEKQEIQIRKALSNNIDRTISL